MLQNCRLSCSKSGVSGVHRDGPTRRGRCWKTTVVHVSPASRTWKACGTVSRFALWSLKFLLTLIIGSWVSRGLQSFFWGMPPYILICGKPWTAPPGPSKTDKLVTCDIHRVFFFLPLCPLLRNDWFFFFFLLDKFISLQDFHLLKKKVKFYIIFIAKHTKKGKTKPSNKLLSVLQTIRVAMILRMETAKIVSST